MADGTSTITPPPGYTVETQQPAAGITPPPGYTVEGQPPPASTIGPQPQASDLNMPSLGSSVSSLTIPLVKGLLGIHEKLKQVENMTQEGREAHPIQAKIGDLANSIEGLLIGNPQHPEAGIGTGQEGLLTNPVTASLAPGAGGEPALAGIARGGANLIKSGVAAVSGGSPAATEAATETPGLVKQVLKGKEVAQEPAKAAVRATVGAEEEAPLLEGHSAVVDDQLQNIATQKQAAYKQMDDAAGFDVKATRQTLKDAEYKVKQPEIDDAAKARLNKTIAESKQSLADAEQKMQAAGIDPKAADTLNKQWQAGLEFRKALVRNLSSDGESVNVDGLLKASKNLRNMSKYGDRLEQFMGKEGADTFMSNLQNAQELGSHAMKVQQIAKWIAGVMGAGALGGETVHMLTR